MRYRYVARITDQAVPADFDGDGRGHDLVESLLPAGFEYDDMDAEENGDELRVYTFSDDAEAEAELRDALEAYFGAGSVTGVTISIDDTED